MKNATVTVDPNIWQHGCKAWMNKQSIVDDENSCMASVHTHKTHKAMVTLFDEKIYNRFGDKMGRHTRLL
jgi:hypothetical protein